MVATESDCSFIAAKFKYRGVIPRDSSCRNRAILSIDLCQAWPRYDSCDQPRQVSSWARIQPIDPHNLNDSFMSKKKTSAAAEKGSKRPRRSFEERMAALKSQMALLERRKATAEMKKDPALSQSLNIVRSLDKALNAANETGHEVRHAIAAARKPLCEYLESQGVKLPKARMPRGRKPKAFAG